MDLKNLQEQIEELNSNKELSQEKMEENQELLSSIVESDDLLLRDDPELLRIGSTFGLSEENTVLDLKMQSIKALNNIPKQF